MKPSTSTRTTRRQPKQQRALETVDAVLDAVLRILKREGAAAVTTNRIAEVAGVSIGSLYQYFPDKRAIFHALHSRHIEQVDQLIERTLAAHASSALEELVKALMEAMIEVHEGSPELYQALMAEVPHNSGGRQAFAVRLHGVFLLAIAARLYQLKKHHDPLKTAFVVAQMVDALSHAVVLPRPQGLSRSDLKKEAVRAVVAYLHS
jgi:AcrR family transcriptional regulator